MSAKHSKQFPIARRNSAKLFALAKLLLKPTIRKPPDQWAADNRTYPDTAGVPGPRNPNLTPYVVPFSRAVHNGLHKRFVFVTAAQTGKTDTILDIIGARLDQRPVPIIYVGPTKEFLTDQFEPRLMALLDEAPSLKIKVERGKRMKKTLKRIAGVRLRLAHAGSSAALKSDPAALAIVDEYDEMSRSINSQGDALGLVEARGFTYADFAAVIASTCSVGSVETYVDGFSGLEFWKVANTDDIKSPIWALWQEGTMYHWTWPCIHCGEYFVPRMSMLQWPKTATPAQAKRDTFMACPHCGGILYDEQHKEIMNAAGELIAPGEKISKERVIEGRPNDSSTWSMWVSGLASPFVTWGQRVEAYLTALASGEPEKMQTAMNAGFGELFSAAAGSDKPEWQEVMSRRLNYKSGDVPNEIIRLVMGVDVQKMSLIYVVRGYGSRGASWQVECGQLYGPTDEEDVWNALQDRMLTPFDDMQVERVLIDSGFRPDKPDLGDEHRVYEFCRQWSWLCKATKGVATASQPYVVSKIEVGSKGKKAKYSIDLVRVNTDFFKSLVYSRLRTPIGQPGAFYLPMDTTEDYARQLVSEARVINSNGKPEWVRINRANHFLDAEALCAVAAYSLNVQRLPDGLVRKGVPSVSVTKSEVAQAADDEVVPSTPAPPAKGGTTDLRSKFAGLSSNFNR